MPKEQRKYNGTQKVEIIKRIHRENLSFKDHFREIVFLNQPLQCTVDGRLLGWHSQWAGNHKIVVGIFCTQCFLCHILLCFEFNEHFSDRFGQEDGSDTAIRFRAFQNLNRGTAGTQ